MESMLLMSFVLSPVSSLDWGIFGGSLIPHLVTGSALAAKPATCPVLNPSGTGQDGAAVTLPPCALLVFAVLQTAIV